MSNLTSPYYEDGSVTIYHGEALDVLAGLPAGLADVLLTDPPYSSGGMFRADRTADPAQKYRGWTQGAGGVGSRPPTAAYGSFGGDNKDQWAWIRWVTAWSSLALRATKVNGHAFMFSDWRQLPAATDALQFGGWVWRSLLVWDKGVARPIKGQFRNHLEYVVWATHGGLTGDVEDYPSALISVPTVGHHERQHVTQKPVAVLSALLRVVGAESPMTVLDPFMGSGSTLVAARDEGHRVVGIEIEERYCEIAATRLAQGVLDFGKAA